MRRYLIAIATVALIVVGTGMYVGSLRMSRQYETDSKILQPLGHTFDVEIPGRFETTLADARQLAGFRILIPSKVPANLTLASVRVVPYGAGVLVYLFYSPRPLTGTISLNEVIGSGGLVIIENADTRDPVPIIQAILEQGQGNLQPTTVKGANGIAGGNLRHEIQWWSNGIHFDMIASVDMSLDTLIVFANSMV